MSTPWRARAASLLVSRQRTSGVMSTSTTAVACGAVCTLRTICSAMALRIGVLAHRDRFCPHGCPGISLSRSRGTRIAGRGYRAGGHGGIALDLGELAAHRDRRALRGNDLDERTGHRRWHLGIHLVRDDLYQRLVALHVVALCLEPAGDHAFGDGLTELRHRNRRHH